MRTHPPNDDVTLSALLSQALVAFIIEFDNEFEHQTPHRTAKYGSTTGARDAPWLVSMAMWSMLLRHVPDEGIAVRELLQKTQMPAPDLRRWLTRTSKWWGYLVVEPGGVVRPTPGGRRALEVWRPLAGTIEERWRERFGAELIDELRAALWDVASHLEVADYLPILEYGLFSRAPRSTPNDAGAGLHVLLSKVLLGFALEFERESEVSLAICANVLRLAVDGTIRVKDIPKLAGVSREATAMALGWLKRHGYLHDSALTAKGRSARDTYEHLVRDIEQRWGARYGQDAIAGLRESLERLVGSLFRGLEPYADGWRARVPRPQALPHYPMILHRGGYPDGS